MKTPYSSFESEKSRNSFQALRLFLALSVVISHVSGSVYGWNEIFIGDFSIGTLAVFGFFAISGYLVTPGVLRSGIKRYVVNRLARIYPGYLFCIALTVLIFYPLWLFQDKQENFSRNTAFSFILKNSVLFPQSASSPSSTWNSLGGVPTLGSHPAIVNASIWTLPLELTCYASLAVFVALVRVFRRERSEIIISFFIYLFWVTSVYLAITFPQLTDKQDLLWNQLLTKWPYFLAFATGVLIRILHKLKKSIFIFTSFGLIVFISVNSLILWAVCGSAMFSYLLIQIGESASLKRLSNFRDISYGLYLFHFPVIQVLVGVELFHHSFVLLILASVALTAFIAYVSSRFIEIPAQIFVTLKFRKSDGSL